MYLLIVAAMMALASGVIPLGRILSEGSVVEVRAFGLKDALTGEVLAYTTHVGILMGLAALLPLVTIFLFKKRLLQIRLCVVELVLLLGSVVLEVGLLLRSRAAAGAGNFAFTAADVFPLVALILTWLALRAIFKDQILVKSLDRIR